MHGFCLSTSSLCSVDSDLVTRTSSTPWASDVIFSHSTCNARATASSKAGARRGLHLAQLWREFWLNLDIFYAIYARDVQPYHSNFRSDLFSTDSKTIIWMLEVVILP